MGTDRISIGELGGAIRKDSIKILEGVSLGIIKTGDLSHRYMIEYIDNYHTKRQRKAGKPRITRYIKKYYPKNINVFRGFRYGIGSVSLLNSKAKYWNRIDKGFLPPPSRGFFKDRGGRTVYLKGASGTNTQIFYPSVKFPIMVPHKPYKGMHYISKTAKFFLRRIGKNIEQCISITMK